MTKQELAAMLGISGAMVSKLAKRGMPTHSVDAAQRWRRRHLEPSRVKGVRHERPRRPAVDPVAHAAALGLLAAGDFPQHEAALRAALRAVPEDQQDAVALPVEVWEWLYGGDALALLQGQGDPAEDALLSPEEAAQADAILWGLATGRWQVAPAGDPLA